MRKRRVAPLTTTTATVIGTVDLAPPPSDELTDEQADWVLQRLGWALGFNVIETEFFRAFGVALGLKDEHQEEARAAVRRIARLAL